MPVLMGSSMTRRFFLAARTCMASSWNDGATTTSRKRSFIASAASRVTTVLNATMPPNAETGSQARARSNASCGVVPSAMPHGVVCFTMQQATRVLQHETAHIAASMSSRLLKESSLPCRWARSRVPRGSSVT